MEEWRCSSTRSLPCHWVGVSGQLHARPLYPRRRIHLHQFSWRLRWAGPRGRSRRFGEHITLVHAGSRPTNRQLSSPPTLTVQPWQPLKQWVGGAVKVYKCVREELDPNPDWLSDLRFCWFTASRGIVLK